jgi:hypothetical protein
MTKKNCVIAAVLLAMTAGLAFAQPMQKKNFIGFAPGIAEKKVFLNAGIGLGLGNVVMPPISASLDFNLPIKIPLTLGALAGFKTWDGYYILKSDDNKVTVLDVSLGLRGMVHFNFLKNLDVYAGGMLGYTIRSKIAAIGFLEDASQDVLDYIFKSGLLFGVDAGARYFFTPFLGAYLEVGFSSLKIASAGVTLKF